MKTDTLKAIKTQMANFKEAIEPTLQHWESNKFTMIKTLLQNLSFYSPNSVGYEHEKEVVKCEQIIAAIRNIAHYETNCHTTNYIAEEIEMIWDGLSMAEEFEMDN